MAVIGACHATWTLATTWNGGFQLAFTLTNSGTAPTTDWSVSYSWPGGQTVTQIWNAAFAQSGAMVNITNLSYDGTVASGGSRTFGLNANGTAPSTLTGLQCTSR
jgi:cellulase/cellobiase CelA1